MPTLTELGIDELSTEDRLSIAEAIWESVAAETPLTPAQQTELERRIAAADADPERGTPWEDVRADARAR
jgi:putative addiction module component (TIGR02574 family)